MQDLNPHESQDEFGKSLADAWHELDRKAEAENPGAYRQAEQMMLEWANKLGFLKKPEV
jgi:hypothetical protein